MKPYPGFSGLLRPRVRVESLDDDIRRLFLRLEELRRADHDRLVYGSRKHGYRYAPLSRNALAKLEGELGVELPDECRRWLLGIGGSAGPGYGLDLIDVGEDPWMRGHSKAATSWRVLDDAEALNSEFLARAMAAFGQPGEDSFLFALRSYRGLIQLAEHGCGAAAFLIVAGPQAGRVIDDWILAWPVPDGAAGVFAAAGESRSGRLPTFLEWIEHWIESSIRALPMAREQRARVRPPNQSGR